MVQALQEPLGRVAKFSGCLLRIAVLSNVVQIDQSTEYQIDFLQRHPISEGCRFVRATLNKWVVIYSPQIALKAHTANHNTNRSWRMDETFVRVKGKWQCLYRAVDMHGNTLDFMLSERRNTAVATKFFANALAVSGILERL